jgi:hypothetical protein
MPSYACSVVIEDAHWNAAHAVGLSRTLLKKIRGQEEHERREEETRIDTEGALAEILVAFLLEKSGATIAPLVAYKPDRGVDIVLADKKLDVKSVGQAKAYCNINTSAHTSKAPAAYIVVRFTRSDTADIFVVNAEGVSSWKQNTFAYGKPLDPRRYYYSAKLPTNLEPLPEEAEAI